jgi:hypothetical protein
MVKITFLLSLINKESLQEVVKWSRYTAASFLTSPDGGE